MSILYTNMQQKSSNSLFVFYHLEFPDLKSQRIKFQSLKSQRMKNCNLKSQSIRKCISHNSKNCLLSKLYEVSAMLGNAYPRAFTPSNAISGFQVTGIYPYNRNFFTDDKFLASSVTDRQPQPNEDQENPEEQPEASTE